MRWNGKPMRDAALRLSDEGDPWWYASCKAGGNAKRYSSREERQRAKDSRLVERRRLKRAAEKCGCDLDDRKTWPKCCGVLPDGSVCGATLDIFHAQRFDRCVVCINRAGDYRILEDGHYGPDRERKRRGRARGG